RRHFSFLWTAVLLLLAPPELLAAPDARLVAATAGIEKSIQESGAEAAVAFRTLDGKEEWFLPADEPFHAASTMKVAVMIELYHQVRQGKLQLDESLTVRNEFK